MKSPVKVTLCAALMIVALPALSMGALAKDNDHDRGDRGNVHRVPGPIAGAGLPIACCRLWRLLAKPAQLAVTL